MVEMNEHPEIKELISALDENGMHKEKAEVQSLVSYIGDMEKTLTGMLEEMQEMRKEISLIHNGTLRAKCHKLAEKTEGKIKQVLAVVGRIKDNFLSAVKNALKTLKEKGKGAFRGAVKGMRIPETLDMLGKMFGKVSRDMEKDVTQINSMQTELNSAKGHLKNIGRLLIGRQAKDAAQGKADKGILFRFGKLIDKIGKGFGSLSQKAMDKADKIRVTHVKESVKSELDSLKAIKTEPIKATPAKERG